MRPWYGDATVSIWQFLDSIGLEFKVKGTQGMFGDHGRRIEGPFQGLYRDCFEKDTFTQTSLELACPLIINPDTIPCYCPSSLPFDAPFLGLILPIMYS